MITLFSLLIVAAYVVISIAVTVAVAKKKNARAAGFVAAALFLLGTWDVILGRAALWYSCEYSRISIVPQVKIPMPEKYFNRNGHLDLFALEKDSPYAFQFKATEIFPLLGLEERRATITDYRTRSDVIVKTSFGVAPGWLERLISPLKQSCSNFQFDFESAFEVKRDQN